MGVYGILVNLRPNRILRFGMVSWYSFLHVVLAANSLLINKAAATTKQYTLMGLLGDSVFLHTFKLEGLAFMEKCEAFRLSYLVTLRFLLFGSIFCTSVSCLVGTRYFAGQIKVTSCLKYLDWFLLFNGLVGIFLCHAWLRVVYRTRCWLSLVAILKVIEC